MPNRVVTGLSAGGALTVYAASGPVDVAIDLVGWYAPDAVAPDGAVFTSVVPHRVLDTRDGTGVAKGAVTAGHSVAVAVRGGDTTVPADATAVAVTLTATQQTKRTFVTAWPSGLTRPTASDLNADPGLNVANLAIVPIGADGKVALYNNLGSVQLVADVLGYYVPAASP